MLRRRDELDITFEETIDFYRCLMLYPLFLIWRWSGLENFVRTVDTLLPKNEDKRKL